MTDITRPKTTQVMFRSRRTGNHVLDDYLEACEKGDRPLSDLLSQILVEATGDLNPDALQLRVDPATMYLQSRFGIFEDPEEGWVNSDLRMFMQRGTWAPGIDFVLLDMTTHEGTVYICIEAHTSLTTFDPTKFSVLFEGVVYEASNTIFDNIATALAAINVQAAIDEIVPRLVATETLAAANQTNIANLTAYYTATVAGSNLVSDWTQTLPEDPWVATLNVPGLLADDRPAVSLDLSAVAIGDIVNVEGSFALLYRAVASADTLTLYATFEPYYDFALIVQVIRDV